MTQYYFLTTSLPRLQLEVLPDLSFSEFEVLIKDNLSAIDFAKIEVLRRYYDMENIRAFWKKEPLDYHGNWDENELERCLIEREGLPGYVCDFLEKYETLEERLHHFSALMAAYFREELVKATGLLKRVLAFERELRLVFIGFRAKQLGRDVVQELQYESPEDELVGQIIAQKDAKTYTPPDKYRDLTAIFETNNSSPLALHLALCQYRFRRLEARIEFDLFSIDRIIGYMAQLIVIEKWHELDEQKGLTIVNDLLRADAMV